MNKLPKGWEMKTLGDLFEITSSKRVFKEDWKTEGVPFYRAREIVKLAENGFVNNELFISEAMFKEYSEKYGLSKADDIMVTGVGTLGICYVVKSDHRFYFKDGNIIWLKSNGKANSRYVEYAFKSDFLRKQIDDSVGATVGTYTIIKAKNTKISLPPLPEQRRIVSLLDEAFSAIEQSRKNAEQNLKNAKELFESYLFRVFENGNWEKKTIEMVCDEIFAGGDAPKNNFSLEPTEKHKIPIYANAVKDRGLYGYTDFARVTKPCVTISARGSGTGHTELRNEPFLPIVRLIVCIPDTKQISTDFLKYTIDNLVIQRSGSAIPQLTVPMFKENNIPVPGIEEQTQLIVKAKSLQAETQKLEAIYQQKLLNLEELKKSILQKAFAGELTTTGSVANGKG